MVSEIACVSAMCESSAVAAAMWQRSLDPRMTEHGSGWGNREEWEIPAG